MASKLKIKLIPDVERVIQDFNSMILQLNQPEEKKHSEYLDDKGEKKSLNTQEKSSSIILLEKDKKTIQNNRWLVDWSIQQDEMLFKKYIELGSKWSDLTHFLPNKSDNAIKNRFNCCMRKVQRKMNKVQKDKKINQRKLIKYESLLTFLEIGKVDCLQYDKRLSNAAKNLDRILEVRDIIIEQAKKQESDINDKDIQSLIYRFLDVKYSLKFMNVKRIKKSSQIGLQNIDKQSTLEASFMQQQNNEQQQEIIPQNERRGSNSLLDFQIMKSDYFEREEVQKTINLIEDCQIILNLDHQEQKFDYQFFLRP